jgi:hypothetical protein
LVGEGVKGVGEPLSTVATAQAVHSKANTSVKAHMILRMVVTSSLRCDC